MNLKRKMRCKHKTSDGETEGQETAFHRITKYLCWPIDSFRGGKTPMGSTMHHIALSVHRMDGQLGRLRQNVFFNIFHRINERIFDK